MNKDQARSKIERYINSSGGVSHNLIGFALRQLAKSTKSNKDSNELIDEYSLQDLYGINKEPEG